MHEKPRKSNITIDREGSRDSQFEATLPAKKGIDFLMLLGILFAGLPLLIAIFTIYSIIRSSADNSITTLLITLGILSIFTTIGGALFFFGLKMRYTSHRIKIHQGAVEITKQFFKRQSTQKIAAGHVINVGLYSFSSTNNKPNYNLIIKAKDEEDIKLSSGHKEDELRWLSSKMLEALSLQEGLPSDQELEQHILSEMEADIETTPDGAKQFQHSGVTITALPDETFTIEKKRNPFFNGILSIIGLAKKGDHDLFAFLTDTITHEKIRNGRSKSKQTYQKSNIKTLTVKNTGSSNDDPRYSVTVEASNKELKLFHWVSSEISTITELRFNQWLNPTHTQEAQTPDPSNTSGGFAGYGSSMKTEASSLITPAHSSLRTPTPDEVRIFKNQTSISDIKGGIWFFRLFISLFIIAGIVVTTIGIKQYYTAKASTSWPSTEGVITSSKVEVEDSDDGVTYSAKILYRYTVNGTKHTGDKVTVSEVSSSNQEAAKTIVRRYDKKQKTSVYYNPEKPEYSILEPGITKNNWFLPIFGLVFFSVGMLFLIIIERSFMKERKKKQRKADNNKANHPPTSPHSAAPEDLQKRYGKIK